MKTEKDQVRSRRQIYWDIALVVMSSVLCSVMVAICVRSFARPEAVPGDRLLLGCLAVMSVLSNALWIPIQIRNIRASLARLREPEFDGAAIGFRQICDAKAEPTAEAMRQFSTALHPDSLGELLRELHEVERKDRAERISAAQTSAEKLWLMAQGVKPSEFQEEEV